MNTTYRQDPVVQLLILAIYTFALGLSWTELARDGVPVFRNSPLATDGMLALGYSIYLGLSIALLLSSRHYSTMRTVPILAVLIPCIVGVAVLGSVKIQSSFVNLIGEDGRYTSQFLNCALPGALALGLSHSASQPLFHDSYRIQSARRLLGTQLLLSALMLLLPVFAALIAQFAARHGNSGLLVALSEVAATTHGYAYHLRVFGYQAPLALILGASLCLIVISLISINQWKRPSK